MYSEETGIFSRNVAIIVNGFSTSALIPAALKPYEYDCIHILSKPDHPKKNKIISSDYIATFTFEGDIKKLQEELSGSKLNILFCVSGDDDGVKLADQINHVLALPTSNGIEHSAAKTDKSLMNEVARKAGLPVVRQCKTNDLTKLKRWITTDINTWPIVLKPTNSASSDNVHICQNMTDVENAFSAIIGSKDKFGNINKVVLAEEYNEGDEYLVSTISCRGKHQIVEMWKVNKIPGTTIHDVAEFITRETHPELFSDIEDYCFTLIGPNGFNIQEGPCTIEVKYSEARRKKASEACTDSPNVTQEIPAVASPSLADSEKRTYGTRLIEIGMRLMSGAPLHSTYSQQGNNPLLLMLQAYLKPDSFLNTINNNEPLPSSPSPFHVLAVLLISTVEGELPNGLPELVDFLKTLIIVQRAELPKKGDHIQVTTNVGNSPGVIYLRSEDPTALEAAYRGIRQLEASGLYQRAIAAKPANPSSPGGNPHLLLAPPPQRPGELASQAHTPTPTPGSTPSKAPQ